jgi:hypothetical protein
LGVAIWLFLALFQWYFAAVFMPFSEGVLTAVPAFGAMCLVIGIALGIKARARALWFY